MNWSGIIGALLIFVITLGMVLFLALRELWRKRHCGILGVVFSLFFSAAMLRVMATKPNPYVPDYELAPKIVVGADAVSLSAALESSEPYSVIEIPSGEALVSRSLVFPNYPVSLLPPTELTTNSAFFASDVDLSCVSVWNADGYTQKCATAVSPYHVVGAAHWQVAANVNVYFLGRDGVVYSNKVVASRSYEYHYWNSPFSTLDVSVGILATPLPESVGKAKILPIDSLDHLWEGRYLPVLSVNQDRDVYIREISSSILPNTPVGNPYKSATTTSISYGVPSAPARKSYYGQIRSGDSSCPNFFVLNNEPVLLGCNLTASAAPSILLTGGHIQRMMDELSDERSKPRCALQYIDVSSFDAIEIRKK